ncbi:MAG: hypothetical protein RJA76_2093 [Bacteroidota bacterium]
MIFFAVVQAASGQTIEYRNNCLDSCNIDKKTGQIKIETVFEVNSLNVFQPGTRFRWKINGSTLPIQVDKSSVNFTFSNKGNYPAEVIIEEPSRSPITVNKNIIIGGVPSVTGSGVGFNINNDVKDTLIELCSVSPKVLRVPNSYINANYDILWFPNGEVSSSITVDKEGCYSAKVFEKSSGCFYEARSVIKYCGDAKVDLATSIPSGSSCEECPRWDLGNNARIIFDQNGTPQVEVVSGISIPNNSSIITIDNHYGANINLRGLTFNGESVYDFSGRLIETVLYGDKNFPQGVSIIPKDKCKGCNSVFYLFSTKRDGNSNKFYYHIFDISQNSGRGGFIKKDILIQNSSSAGKIEIVHLGGYNYRIFNLDEKHENIYLYKIDSLGVSVPEIIPLGSNSPSVTNNFGVIKLNRLKDKLAITISPNKVKLFDLTRNPLVQIVELVLPTVEINGLEFSPNGDLLYTSAYYPTLGQSKVHQFDLNASNIQASDIYQVITFGRLGAMNYDPINQSKLYVTREGSTDFLTIDLPNTRIIDAATAGVARVNERGLSVKSGTNLGLGLPTLTPKPPSGDEPKVSVICDGINYKFSISQDLCEKDPNKNNEVIFRIYYSSNKALGIIIDPTTRKKIVNTLVSTLEKEFRLTKPINSDVNNVSYDFDADLIPKRNGYYIVEVLVRNRCMSPGKYYPIEPVGFDVQILRPFRLKNQIDKIRNIVGIGVSSTCVFPSYSITPILVSSTATSLPPGNPDLIVPGDFPIRYSWSNNTSNPILTVPFPNGEGRYSLEINDPLTGCKDRSNTEINFYTENNLPPIDYWDICMDAPIPRTNLVVFPNSINLSYNWSQVLPLNPNQIVSPIPWNQNNISVSKDGQYRVQLTDDYSCTLDRTFIVPDRCLPEVIAPTVFNPHKLSSDGSIARFYPLYNWPVKDYINQVDIPGSNPTRKYEKNRVKALSFKVFNRWGQLVFERDFDSTKLLDPNFDIKRNGWDGTYNGNLVPQDTYAWVIEYESNDFPNLGKQSKSGAVLVVY